MWQVIAAGFLILCGIVYYMQAGPVLAPLVLIIGGGLWALIASIKVAQRKPQ